MIIDSAGYEDSAFSICPKYSPVHTFGRFIIDCDGYVIIDLPPVDTFESLA